MLSTFLHPNKNHRRTATRAAVIVLIFFATMLFPAHPSRAVSFVMSPNPAVIVGSIADEVSTVGAFEFSWSLLAVDTVLARYTFNVEGTIVGSVLPSPGEDFFIQLIVFPFPIVCCVQFPEVANVSNAIVTGAIPTEGTEWGVNIEPLAPTFSFEVSEAVISVGRDPSYPPGTPVLLTGQEMRCNAAFFTAPFFLESCFPADVSFTVPEPSTILLFGSGLAGLGLWRYRKNRKG